MLFCQEAAEDEEHGKSVKIMFDASIDLYKHYNIYILSLSALIIMASHDTDWP